MTNEPIGNTGKMVPLTIEQLREMANKPYWHVGLQTDSPEPRWKILDPFVARCPEDYGYGKRWLAYACPTAHIDREAWEPCKKCRSCPSCISSDLDFKKFPCSQCEEHCYFIPMNFCPHCGRPLTSDAWDKLEKGAD